MLIETFAQYAALLVMEDIYGPEHMRRFLKYELDRYLSSRGSDYEEHPLSTVENQPYIHYRKGSVAMWRLRFALGEDVLNRALKRTLEELGYQSDPYPRSVDFIRILKEEAGEEHHALIEDTLEKIVLYDIEVEQVSSKKNAEGRFEVTLEVNAKKFEADPKGVETEVDDFALPIQVGVFSKHPKDVKEGRDHVLAFERQTLRPGSQRLTVVVDEEPSFAGTDPYNTWIDRNSNDNIRTVD